MKKHVLLLFIAIAITSCQEKPKPKPTSVAEDLEKAGKTFRTLKDAFKKGYNDTTKVDTTNLTQP